MKVVRSGFWRIYFWLFAAITLLSFVVLFIPWIVPDFGLEFDAEEFGGALLAAIELLGLYGFMKSQKIGNRSIWMLVYCVSISYAMYSLYSFSATSGNIDEETAFQTWTVVFVSATYALWIPLWIALYRYVWSERRIWATAA